MSVGDRKRGARIVTVKKASYPDVRYEGSASSHMTRMLSGGGMRLEALGTTAVNVKAGPQTIKMKDKSKLNVHGEITR